MKKTKVTIIITLALAQVFIGFGILSAFAHFSPDYMCSIAEQLQPTADNELLLESLMRTCSGYSQTSKSIISNVSTYALISIFLSIVTLVVGILLLDKIKMLKSHNKAMQSDSVYCWFLGYPLREF
ncbi:MAG: hypothetical protein MJK11_20850 [Pseudomonadales bacterium]|nr:hypothetical protein [Pseudomonadales bacterium]